MSYILEALKKSQSDRELGQVPRVEGFGIDVPMEPARRRPWAYLALLAALLTAGVMIFLLLRGVDGATGSSPPAPQALALPEPQPAAAMPAGAPVLPPPEVMSLPPANPDAATITDTRDLAGGAAPGPAAAPSPAGPAQLPETRPPATATPAAMAEPAPAVDRTVARAAPAGALDLDDPDNLSVEPEVLVVPAPAKPGEPLPRGAEELRRAVLGGGERLSASVDGSRALPAPPPPEEALPSASPSNDLVPVPDDLLAEIEAFKELVRKQDPSVTKRAVAAPPPLPEPPGLELQPATGTLALPSAPSLDLRNRLPPFSMNVHVYNADPKRRFVYINGRKLTENQESREGLLLERVVADGAVLNFEGERFFQRR